MDWLRLAIEELEKRNSISAEMARNQHRELLARIQELETTGREYVEAVKNPEIYELSEQLRVWDALQAALLNNTEKE